MISHHSSGRYATLKRYALLLGIMWTALVAVSFGWNLLGLMHSAEDHARIRAKVAFDKDVFYRRWNAQHGGVYARADGNTVPNPYLEVPERNISTPSGIPLTLINPAYMTRMVHEIQATGNGVLGHITSLNPIRPENEADSWEKAALKSLEKGEREVSSVEHIDGKPFMRLMRPLMTEKACLQCHSKQGYKTGDLRGGISVSVPMERLWTASRESILVLAFSHAAIWILGILVLYGGTRRIGIRFAEEERKETALLESEERYRQMFHESRAVKLIIDPETSFILNANQAAADFYGYSLDELAQMKISDINVLPPEKIFQEMAKAKARRLNYFLFQHRLKSGEIRDVEVHSTPLRIQDKKVLYSIIHDITDRKKALRERIEAEERYRSLFSSITDPIMVFAAETLKIKDVNDAALRLYGYSRDEFLNLKSLDVSADAEESLASYRETLAGKRSAVPFRYHKKKDGTVFPVEISASSFVMKGEKVLCGVIRDITERRQAEEALKNAYGDLERLVRERTAELTRVNEKLLLEIGERKRAEDALGLEREQLISIFESINEVILVIDPRAHEILYTNKFTEDLYGKKLIGRRCYEELNGLDAPCTRCTYDRLTNLQGKPYQWEYHNPVLKKDFLATDRIIKWPDGREVKFEFAIDITGRKSAEQALRESEERYRTLFESAGDCIYILDAEGERAGQIVSANPAAAEMHGYTVEEMLTLHIDELDTPESAKKVKARIERVLRGEPVKEEVTHRRKDGTVFPLEINARLLELGGHKYSLAIDRDITERKRAQETLRLSEERYRRLFEDAPLIYVITRNKRGVPFISYCNELFLRSVGHTREEVQGKPLADYYSPESRTELFERGGYARALAGEFFMGERELVRRDGSLLPTLLYTATELDSHGRVIGTRAMFVDITERKKAEEAIRKSEEMLELALQGADIGLWDWNLKTGTAVWNERATRMIGYSLEELQPDVRTWKRLVHPEDWPHVSEVLNGHLEGRLPFFEVEYRLRCKSGEWKWILGRGKVVEHDEHGKPSRMTGTSLDVTARKRAELERAVLRAQLIQAQKMEAIGTLAGGIAHDFNNLLTVILGYSDLIISEKQEGDKEYGDLKKIIHAGRTAADMVQQILAFSRKTETKPRPINLNKQVEQIEKMLSRLIPKTIEVEISLDPGLPTVNADPAQIEQVLLNLAVNARDAMPNGGRLLIETQTVELDEKYCSLHIEASQGPHALLVVRDTGIGIDKTTMHRIFEPFYTSKKPGQGTGLGLAMVYGIVKSHGGHVTCESEPGRGATFRIHLPAHQAEGEADVTVSGEFSPLGEGTILLVDDEEFVRDLGRRILEKAGYTVITATNGQEAVEVYKEKWNQISLVILDLIMPVMDGNQCLQEILKLDPKTKVLIASGYSPDGTLREPLEGGAKGFVGKPFNLKQLLRTIRDALKET